MQTVEHRLDVSAEMQQQLEQLRHVWRLPSTNAVLELLISTQLDRTVYDMTGIKPGPRLAIDNTNIQG